MNLLRTLKFAVPVAIALQAAATSQTFDYPDFSSTAGINLVLTSGNPGNVLRVHDTTGTGGDNQGAAWYATPVSVVNGFETTFQFQITGTGSGDGMAFVIQNDTVAGYNGMSGAMGIGRHASALGYGLFPTSSPNESLENSLAIELDHFLNANQPSADPILDPDNNHISIHTGGTADNKQQEYQSIGRATTAMLGGADLNDGSVHTLRIVYVPGTLEVHLNGSLVLSVAYDFNTGGTLVDSGNAVGGLNLIGGTSAYVGFTAASGGSTQAHDVLSWSFSEGAGVGTPFCSPANVNSTGLSTTLSGSFLTGGGIGGGLSDLHLECSNGVVGELGYFLLGTVASDPGITVSNGRLCLASGQFFRYNVAGTTSNSVGLFNASGVLRNVAGTSSVGPVGMQTGFDVPDAVSGTGQMITAGSTWHFQVWHRDTPAAVGTSNFSNGLSVMF